MRLLDWMVHALRVAGTGFLACLVAGPSHAQRGYESDEKDPLKLSLQLQAPQGLYPGIVAIERFHGRLQHAKLVPAHLTKERGSEAGATVEGEDGGGAIV